MTPEQAKTLTKGDEVLVRMTVMTAKPDDDGEVRLIAINRLGLHTWVDPWAIVGRAPPKPLAVGDTVRTVTGFEGVLSVMGSRHVCLTLDDGEPHLALRQNVVRTLAA